MNMLKGLREITFPIWGSEVAKMMGCRTPRAQQWYKNCTDTHQAWEHTLIEAATLGLEIMSKFVMYCLNVRKLKMDEITLQVFLDNYIEEAFL